MNDVLPDAAPLWLQFDAAVRDVAAQYGYRYMQVPLVEATPLFVRAIGEVTDVVEKEMYTFDDRLNGESLTLRPEATAGIVRAAIEHNLIYDRPQRVWTSGPGVPARASAEGPLPAVLPVRCRSAGIRRARRRRRADRHAASPVARAGSRRHRPAHQFDRRPRGAPGPPRRTRRVFQRACCATRRGLAAPSADQSPAHPRQQEPRAAVADRRCAAPARPTRQRLASTFRRTAAVAHRSRHRVRGRTRASCAASIITTGPCSNGSPTGSARRAPSAAAAATTACSRSWAASRRRPAASASASSA